MDTQSCLMLGNTIVMVSTSSLYFYLFLPNYYNIVLSILDALTKKVRKILLYFNKYLTLN